ncbi:hypothetical protein BU17DRAFT_67448 [Hysterangium stoloniferum]|nr:hypothetical protein BU17DRAFT_67448 [Hysterangium stoloniferum]
MSSSTKTSSSSKTSSKVVALPSMTHSLSHLPSMSSVDPRTLHYGALGGSKAASEAKLQQTLQRGGTASVYGGSSSQSHPAYRAGPSHKGTGSNDGDYLMMGKGRKKPA